jgi:hypothetical protein
VTDVSVVRVAVGAQNVCLALPHHLLPEDAWIDGRTEECQECCGPSFSHFERATTVPLWYQLYVVHLSIAEEALEIESWWYKHYFCNGGNVNRLIQDDQVTKLNPTSALRSSHYSHSVRPSVCLQQLAKL